MVIDPIATLSQHLMRTPILLALVGLPVVSSFSLGNLPASAGVAEDPWLVATSKPAQEPLEFDGVFVASEAAELSIWPEAYSGGLLLLEIEAHGSFVREGAVIARFETRGLTEEIEAAERQLRSAQIGHDASVGRAELSKDHEDVTIENSMRELVRSKRTLEGYLEHELEFTRRSEGRTTRGYDDNIQDQQDELKQLEAMYSEDELFIATEEIVLRRNRRRLAESELGRKLYLDRLAFTHELSLPIGIDRRKEKVETAAANHARLVAETEIGRVGREDGLAKSAADVAQKALRLERLNKDLGSLVLHASSDGVLLHGGPLDYGPGRARPERRRGDRIGARSVIAMVAPAEKLSLALTVGEAQLAKVQNGMAVEVKPVTSPDRPLVGRLVLDRYPTAKSASGAENRYGARIELQESRPGLLVGMRAKIAVPPKSDESVLVVPDRAIFGEEGARFCWAAYGDGAAFSRVAIEAGKSKGGETVVKSGVEAGWRLLIAEPGK